MPSTLKGFLHHQILFSGYQFHTSEIRNIFNSTVEIFSRLFKYFSFLAVNHLLLFLLLIQWEVVCSQWTLHIARVATFEWSQGYVVVLSTMQRILVASIRVALWQRYTYHKTRYRYQSDTYRYQSDTYSIATIALQYTRILNLIIK